jgi:mono/diheme cytochrome c family protein
MRKSLLPGMLITAGAAVIGGCNKTEKQEPVAVVVPPPVVSPVVERGGRVFRERCVVCHKVNGTGGTIGSDLTKVGARHDAVYLQTLLYYPGTYYPQGVKMPSFRELPKEDMDAIIAYLLTLK